MPLIANGELPISPHLREILDSGFWILRCGFQIPGTAFRSMSAEAGFRILIVSAFRTPSAIFRIWDSTKENIYQIPDFTSKNLADSGIQIPLLGVKNLSSFDPFSPLKNRMTTLWWLIAQSGDLSWLQ